MNENNDRMTVRVARARIRHAVRGYRLRNLTRKAMLALIEIERSMVPDMVLEVSSPADDECEIVGTPADALVLALRALCLTAPRCRECGCLAECSEGGRWGRERIVFYCDRHKPDGLTVESVPARDAIVTLRRLGYV